MQETHLVVLAALLNLLLLFDLLLRHKGLFLLLLGHGILMLTRMIVVRLTTIVLHMRNALE